MSKMVFGLARRVKLQVRGMRRRTRDKALALRCQIVLLADKKRARPCSVSILSYTAELGV